MSLDQVAFKLQGLGAIGHSDGVGDRYYLQICLLTFQQAVDLIYLTNIFILSLPLMAQNNNLVFCQIDQASDFLSKTSRDNETQLTQSRVVKKLVRKTKDTSLSSRSSSRKFSEKSCENVIVSKFYTKMGSSQLTNDSFISSVRADILNRKNDQKTQKKREPTPVPGYLSRKRSNQKLVQRELQIQNDLLIAQMQNKLKDQKEKAKFYQKRAQISERQLKIKTNKITQLERRLTHQIQKQQFLETKLKAFEELASKNESSLVETKSALQKLKKNVIQSRLAQMQAENAKLRRENQTSKGVNQQLSQQLKTFEIKFMNLERQAQALNNSSKNVLLQKSKEKSAEDIKTKQQYTVMLQNTISKLQIKLNYLNRRKNEELQKLKQKKNQELAKVRNRLSSVNQELNMLRKESEKLKKRVSLPERATLMSCASWSTHDQAFCLSLSP